MLAMIWKFYIPAAIMVGVQRADTKILDGSRSLPWLNSLDSNVIVVSDRGHSGLPLKIAQIVKRGGIVLNVIIRLLRVQLSTTTSAQSCILPGIHFELFTDTV